MKKIVIVALASLLTVSVASAYLGEIVASYRIPAPGTPCGVGVAVGDLYVLTDNSLNMVYRLSRDTGSVIGSFPTPYGFGNRGLCYSTGGHVWIGCIPKGHVYNCYGATGSVFGSWSAGQDPWGLAPFATGDGGAGTTAIFSRDSSPNLVKRHHMTTGSVYASFPLQHSSIFDFAYDFRNKLFWADYNSPPAIYGYSATNGSVVASFPRPYAGPGYGLAYSHSYLWIAMSNHYIYKVKCPGGVGISPASMGKIRAIYK
jgi:hypothetical protein